MPTSASLRAEREDRVLRLTLNRPGKRKALSVELCHALVDAVEAAHEDSGLGGGVGLMANGHIVVAAHGTSFALSEIRIGMWPFVIFRSLSLAVGERRAVALSLTGRMFS